MLKYKILLLIGVCTGTAGQLLMKHGVELLGGLDSFDDRLALLIAVFTSPYILFGLCFTGLSMLLWITVISNLELSYAYPFMALSYVIILVFGKLLFDETINVTRVAGIGCIIAGVIVISRTGGEET